MLFQIGDKYFELIQSLSYDVLRAQALLGKKFDYSLLSYVPSEDLSQFYNKSFRLELTSSNEVSQTVASPRNVIH